MTKLIQVLQADSLIRFNNWLEGTDNHVNPVFIGEFQHPKGKIEAFCKPYDMNKKGLINEIIGFLTAYALGITQPEHAFIAVLPVKNLPGFSAIVRSREENKWMNGMKDVVCFCTSRLDGHSAAIHLGCDVTANSPVWQDLVSDVAKWTECGAAVALDENIAHADRHMNNLLRLSKQNYALIDNGRLINEFDEQWDSEMLDAHQHYNNRLLNSLNTWQTKEPNKEALHSEAIFSSERHGEKFKTIEEELYFWLNKLLTGSEFNQFKQFLSDRTKETPCLLQRRFQRLI